MGIRSAMVALLACGLLVGCSTDPKPKIDSKPTPTSVPSTASISPSSAPSTTLDAVQTVEAWVDARNQALADGDTTLVDSLAANPCATCDDQVEPIRRVYAAGGHFETRGWRVSAAKLASSDASNAKVNVAMVFAAGKTVPKAGAKPVTYGVERHIMVFSLVRVAERWALQRIVYLS